MSAKMTIGGDPESYMQAPTLSIGGEGGGGGGSFFAKIFDALGIGKQVGKVAAGVVDNLSGAQDVRAATKTQNGDVTTGNQENVTLNKEEKLAKQSPEDSAPKNKADVLAQVLNATKPRTADMNNTLIPIDPDIAFLVPKVRM